MKQTNPVTKEILGQIRNIRYKIPQNYKQWDKLTESIANDLTLFSSNLTVNFNSLDRITYACSYFMSLWAIKDAPIYCITKDIIDSLLQTDLDEVEKILSDLPIAIPTFLMLFPDRGLPTPSGDFIEYMVVHVAEKDKPYNSFGTSRSYPDIILKDSIFSSNLSVHCGAIDNHKPGYGWSTGVTLNTDGTISYEKGGDVGFGELNMNLEDQEFTNTLRSLSLQILFLLAYEPELFADVGDLDLGKASGRGFAKPSAVDVATTRYPRWLGKNYRPNIEDSSHNIGGGTHRSPIGHWRKGHWKRVAIGKGRIDRKLVWIRPLRVNSFTD
jgi:hypothetical protein